MYWYYSTPFARKMEYTFSSLIPLILRLHSRQQTNRFKCRKLKFDIPNLITIFSSFWKYINTLNKCLHKLFLSASVYSAYNSLNAFKKSVYAVSINLRLFNVTSKSTFMSCGIYCTLMFSRSISATAAIIDISSLPASFELSIPSSFLLQ